MSSIDEDLRQAESRSNEERLRIGALLLVRYCGFHHINGFTPWFEAQRDMLKAVSDVARVILDGRAAEVELADLRESLTAVLQENDPEGPPFEAEIFDHLVFADDVLDFLISPAELSKLSRALERADELAEAHEELGREEYGGENWEPAPLGLMESEARERDTRGELHDPSDLERSEGFSARYAEAIEKLFAMAGQDEDE
ncbi:hypothetical protein ACFS5L_42455 [Streptomyces phyllanthi]|uniref:DUF416 family protein n=1 Tax=Streptomyces phyllanthi TaxID=1803180 RepID=A0A5N8VW67_9ACTN|nr:hypothetical protein [Streptomyces phyllanthi]MPY39042.1 hypothetical protein [Streptomyces phyllanthi]